MKLAWDYVKAVHLRSAHPGKTACGMPIRGTRHTTIRTSVTCQDCKNVFEKHMLISELSKCSQTTGKLDEIIMATNKVLAGKLLKIAVKLAADEGKLTFNTGTSDWHPDALDANGDFLPETKLKIRSMFNYTALTELLGNKGGPEIGHAIQAAIDKILARY